MSEDPGEVLSAGLSAEGLAQAEEILRGACGDRVRTGFPLASLTSFRIGGPAALYLEPEDQGDLEAAGLAVSRSGIPFVVLGKGSNVLVSDSGFPGLVVRLGQGFRWAARDGDSLSAGSAMPLPALAGVALRHRLAGLEFAVAIPASLGGAVRMNAGAHGGQMADLVERVEVYRLLEGRRVMIGAKEAGFSYRRSGLPADGVVMAATLSLSPGEASGIRSLMDEAREWRRQTQPVAEPNCGSVFKNPPYAHAARLIEEAGLKGARVGGVRVSEKHANFIVAGVGSKATDVVALINLVREHVAASSGVLLETEVHLVGAFPDA